MTGLQVLASILLTVGFVADCAVAFRIQTRTAHLDQIRNDLAYHSGYLIPVYQGISASSDSPVREIEKTSQSLVIWADAIHNSSAESHQDVVAICLARLAFLIGLGLLLSGRCSTLPPASQSKGFGVVDASL